MSLTTDPLVTTKLRPPEARPTLVARPRLIGKLDRESGRRLTLLSAPAGFGKTTLLCEWFSREARPVAWLSLDEGDNDPACFLSYLVAALRSIEEGVGEGILYSLRSPEPPSIEAVAGALVGELAPVPYEEWAIVLDDYHVIEEESVHGIVSYLLDHLPAGAHLVIASRVDPPLPLSRLRARGQMSGLGAADLRFTPGEAASFLADVMGLDLSEEDAAALERRTEGWVAGLQLAALSMRGRGDVSSFAQAFSGSHRDVLDFLAEEVLARQPVEVREFLLKTSILNALTRPLCDAVTGGTDGQEMLERLERENLFVVALDDERYWYRYHRLFADFLRGRLGRERPSLDGELHLRASSWYERRGLISEAIPHALAAPDPRQERAARLIEAGILAAGRRGEFPTALRWVEALSTEAKRRRPRLFTEHALGLTLVGRPDGIEPLLEEAEWASGEVAGEDRAFLLGFAAAVRSRRANLRGDGHGAVELARRALSLLPEEDVDHRNFAVICLGEALRNTGELASASEALAEATETGRAAGHVYGTLTGMVFRARIQAEQGRLGDAERSFRRALRFVSERGVELLPAAGLAHIGMGALLYERNDLDGAERELARGVELAEGAREFSRLVWGYVALSRTKLARGEEESALKMAREAEGIARESGADLQIGLAASWMARLRLGRGHLTEAVALEQERAANADDAADAARVVDLLTSARILHARGRHDEALPMLENLHAKAVTAGRTGSVIEILALKAVSLKAKGEKARAVSTLARALALAEPECYVRTFMDEGAPMAELLSLVLEARQRGTLGPPVPAHYTGKLLAALERDDASAASPGQQPPEPLSERELEVLVLVAAGRTNREVASELFVAQSTVKTHVKNLYRKLGARNRAQALSRARELDLI